MDNAQGQATISTEVNALTAIEKSENDQKINVANAITKTVQVNLPLIRVAKGSKSLSLLFSKDSLFHRSVK